jgi:site-specific recombinase XerD
MRVTIKEWRGFETARELAGFSPDIVPHVLRHTCATWMLQRGVSVYDVAGVLGRSEAVIRKTYGDHAKITFARRWECSLETLARQ